MRKVDMDLIAGIKADCIKLVANALDKGANIEVICKHDYKNDLTPLLVAIIEGNVGVAELLIERGANTNAHTDQALNGGDPLSLAIENDDEEMVELLLDKGLAIRQESDDELEGTHLSYAAENGSKVLVELLLDRGAIIDGKSPLIVERRLISTDNFVTSYEIEDCTPLMFAVNLNKFRNWERVEIVELLLDRGANIEAKDEEGLTPLLHATFSNDIKLTKLLLDRGANPHVVDNQERGVFDFNPFHSDFPDHKAVNDFIEFLPQEMFERGIYSNDKELITKALDPKFNLISDKNTKLITNLDLHNEHLALESGEYSKLHLILNPTPEGNPYEVSIFQNILLKNANDATKSVFGNFHLLSKIASYVGVDRKLPLLSVLDKDISAKFAKLEGPRAKTQESSEPPAKKLAVSSSSSSSGLLMEAPVPHPVLKLMGPNSLTESGSGILVPTIEGFEKIYKDTPVSFSLKSIDVITDLIKLVNNPTGDNFYNLVQDSSLLVCASSFSGNECSIIPLTMSSFSIGDMMESGEYFGVSIKYLQVLSHVALNANNPLGFYGLAMANAALAANDIYEGDYANGVIHTGLLVGGIVAPVTTASLVTMAYTAYNIYEMCTELQMMGEGA